MSSSGQEDAESTSVTASAKKRKKSIKGWDGENGATDENGGGSQQGFVEGKLFCHAYTSAKYVIDPQFSSMRTFTTTMLEDGSAETHVSVRCTLSDIARATNLRVEDAAFALNECGLLAKRIHASENERSAGAGAEGGTGMAGVGAGDVIVLTRPMVEKVSRERNVKKPCMDIAFVKL